MKSYSGVIALVLLLLIGKLIAMEPKKGWSPNPAEGYLGFLPHEIQQKILQEIGLKAFLTYIQVSKTLHQKWRSHLRILVEDYLKTQNGSTQAEKIIVAWNAQRAVHHSLSRVFFDTFPSSFSQGTMLCNYFKNFLSRDFSLTKGNSESLYLWRVIEKGIALIKLDETEGNMLWIKILVSP